jgi:Ni,Fe-hydrogenase maturation factor
VARIVTALQWPGAQALAVHQLTPELAEALADADLALFVDAAYANKEVTTHRLAASFAAVSGHTSDPCGLLGLAQALYGKRPAAWLVTVPAVDQGFGTGLSAIAKCGVRQALKDIRRLIGSEGADARDERRRSARAFPAE